MYNKIKVPDGTEVNTLDNWKQVIEKLIQDLKGTPNINDQVDSIYDMEQKLPDKPLLVIDNSKSFSIDNALSVEEAGRISDDADILNLKLDELDTDTNPEYLEFEGNDISCVGTLEGRTNGMTITGDCYFNYIRDYNKGIPVSSKIRLNPSHPEERMIELGLNASLTPGEYTLYFTTLSKSTKKEIKVYGRDPKGLLYPYVDNTNVVELGISTATFFINNGRYLDNLRLYLDYDEKDSGRLEICNIMILRGNYTGKRLAHFVNKFQPTRGIKVASRNDNFILNGRFKDRQPDKYWKGYREGHMNLKKDQFLLNMKSTQEYNFNQEIDSIRPGHTYLVDFSYTLTDFTEGTLRVELLLSQDSVLIQSIPLLDAKKIDSTYEFKKISERITIPEYINKCIFRIFVTGASGTFVLKDPIFSPNLALEEYVDGFYDMQDIDCDNCFLMNIDDIHDKLYVNSGNKLIVEGWIGIEYGKNMNSSNISNIVSRGEYTTIDYSFPSFSNVNTNKELISDSFGFISDVNASLIYEGVGYINNGFRLIIKTTKLPGNSKSQIIEYLNRTNPTIAYVKKNPNLISVLDDFVLDVKTIDNKTYVYGRATNDCKLSFRVPINMYSIIENNLDSIAKLEYIFDNVLDPFFK